MAHKRVPEQPADDGAMILPRHLVKHRAGGAEQYRAFWTERRDWFKAHGVDPMDWAEQRKILSTSERAYGIPESDALSRARQAWQEQLRWERVTDA